MKPAALVTGASRGIGAAIAAALGAEGFGVLVHYHTKKEPAEAVAAGIRAAGGRAAVAQADLKDAKAPAALVGIAREAFGPIGVLVNNASAPLTLRPMAQVTWEEIQGHLDLFARAALLLAQAVKPDMAKVKWGRIIQIGTSALWDVPPAGFGPYAAAKHALLGLTRSMAAEWGPEGITVNCVSPGMVATDLTSFIPAAVKGMAAQQTPLKRLAEPADVAAVVRMLCSDAGAFVTGAHIPVTGGARMP